LRMVSCTLETKSRYAALLPGPYWIYRQENTSHKLQGYRGCGFDRYREGCGGIRERGSD